MKEILSLFLFLLSGHILAIEGDMSNRDEVSKIVSFPCADFEYVLLNDTLITFEELQNMHLNENISVEDIESLEVLKEIHNPHNLLPRCTLVVRTKSKSEYNIYLCNTADILTKNVTLKFLDNLTFEERVRFGRLDNSKEPMFVNNGHLISEEEFLSIFDHQKIESIEFIENAIPFSCRPPGIIYFVLSE